MRREEKPFQLCGDSLMESTCWATVTCTSRRMVASSMHTIRLATRSHCHRPCAAEDPWHRMVQALPRFFFLPLHRLPDLVVGPRDATSRPRPAATPRAQKTSAGIASAESALGAWCRRRLVAASERHKVVKK